MSVRGSPEHIYYHIGYVVLYPEWSGGLRRGSRGSMERITSWLFSSGGAWTSLEAYPDGSEAGTGWSSSTKAPGARQPASDNVKGDAVRVSHVTTCVSYQVSHPYAARYRCIILFNDNVERAESVRPPRHVVVEMCDRIGGAQRPLPVPNRNPAGTAFAALRIAPRVPVLRPARGTRAAAARRQVCWKSQKSSP